MTSESATQARRRPEGKCLVTGANGFVGSHLVEALLRRGYDLRVLVRRSSSLRWIQGLPIELAHGDVRDKASLAGACVGIRNVFHFGALVAAVSAEDFHAVNETGSRNLAEALAERGEPGGVFVNCSSLAAGGPAIATESQSLPVRRENHADTPLTPYGKSKLAGERAIVDVSESSERFRAVSLRPPAVYGPRDPAVLQFFGWIKRGVLPIGGPEGARLSLIFVNDVVTAAVQVAERDVHGVYYLSDGEVYSWPEIGRMAGEMMGTTNLREIRVPEAAARLLALVYEGAGRITRRPPILNRWKVREMQQLHWVCSDAKARRDWGYTPQVQLEEGLAETLGWYRQHGWL